MSSQTLGTALGDWMADTGLGYLTIISVLVLGLVWFVVRHFRQRRKL